MGECFDCGAWVPGDGEVCDDCKTKCAGSSDPCTGCLPACAHEERRVLYCLTHDGLASRCNLEVPK